ncbi:MAG: adenosine deaminase [Opitutales bacterium]
MDSALYNKLLKLPKVELHNHLEGGSMYPDLALKFAAKNGMSLPFDSPESAKGFYTFTSLDQFIGILRTTVSTLNTAEDYADAVERHGIEAAKQNILYHELFVTYGLVSRRGVKWEAIVEGLEEGIKRNREKHGVHTAFICDLDRTLPEETALEHTKLAERDREKAGIIGIGLDCQEAGYPASRLKSIFDYAKAAVFPLTAHAGEDGGPESVWDALSCGVERIEHGVQAYEDPKLLEHLAEKQILLTVCPISNIQLKVFPEMKMHSIPKLIEAGIPVCVNSDDPPMFDCQMMDELVAVADTFNFSEDVLVKMLRNAIEHSFMNKAEKSAFLEKFDSSLQE